MFLFFISSSYRGDKIWAARCRRLLKNVYFVVNIICTDYIDVVVVVSGGWRSHNREKDQK